MSKQEKGLLLAGALAAVAVVVLVALLRPAPDAPPPSLPVEPPQTAPADTPASAPPPIPDETPDLLSDVPLDVVTGEVNSDLAAARKVPPHEWHTSLVGAIAAETLEECVLHLGNGDDTVLVVASNPGTDGLMGAIFWAQNVPSLKRVRRLLDEGKSDPPALIPLLRACLEDALAHWPAERDRAEEIMKTRPYYNRDDDPYVYIPWRTGASFYILAELSDHDSLPLMADVLKLHKPNLKNWAENRRGPVAPAFMLAAMHKLVLSFPENRLSPEAALRRSEYLESAKGLLPDKYPTVTGTAWRSRYAENDPRFVVLDPSKEALRKEPMTEYPLYPWQFPDGTMISTCEGDLPETTTMLIARMYAFIDAAYPRSP